MEIAMYTVVAAAIVWLLLSKFALPVVGKKLVLANMNKSLDTAGFIRRSVRLPNEHEAWYLERPCTGDADAPPLVILPGATVSMHLMSFRMVELAHELAQRRVLVIELPHHGLNVSTDFDFKSPADSLEGMADYLHDVRTALALETPFDLLGFSLGGGIATQYAVKYPESLGRLLLLVPYFYEIASEPFKKRMDAGEWQDLHGWETYEEMENFFYKWLGMPPTDAPPALVMRGIHALRGDMYPAGYWSACLDALQTASTSANTFLHDRQQDLAAFHGPTLVICGADDAVCDPQKLQHLGSVFDPDSCAICTVASGHSYGAGGITVFEAAHDEMCNFLR